MIIRSSWWKIKYFIWNNIVSPYAWNTFLVLQPTNTSHFSDQIYAQKWLHQYVQLLRLHGAVCIYPMREHAKEQQLLPMFSSHSHNSNCQHRIHLYYYISLQFKRENSFLGKKYRPSAGTDTLSSPGSTSITSLKYLDLWIQAYLSTAAQKQQQVLLCAGWHYFLLFAYWKKAPPPLHTAQGRNKPTLCLQFPCTEVGAVRKFRKVGPERDETTIRKRFLSEDWYNFKA